MGLSYEDLLGFEEAPLSIDDFNLLDIGVDIPTLSANALVGWWDFTDTSTLWKRPFGRTGDWFSSTPLHPSQGYLHNTGGFDYLDVNTNGDIIGRVDNKAYWLQSAGGESYDTGALGAFLWGTVSANSSTAFYKTGGQNGHSYVSFNGNGRLAAGLGGLGNTGTGPQSKSEPLHGYYAFSTNNPGQEDTGWKMAHNPQPASFLQHLLSNRVTMFFVVKASSDPIAGRGRRVISLISEDDGGAGKTQSISFEYWKPADGSDPYYRCRLNDGFVCTQTSGTTYQITDPGNTYYVNSGITGTDTSVGLWTLVLNGQNSSMLYKNGDTSNGNLTESSSNTAPPNVGWNMSWGVEDASDSQKKSRIIIGNRYMSRGSSSDGIPPQNNNNNCTTCEDWLCSEGQNWGFGSANPTTSSDQIYEILIYREALDSDERSQVETYLKNKYNL